VTDLLISSPWTRKTLCTLLLSCEGGFGSVLGDFGKIQVCGASCCNIEIVTPHLIYKAN